MLSVRRTRARTILLSALACLCAAAARGQSGETAVDLELVIAVDVSASMDREELLLQRSGYASAIVHPDFLRAVGFGRHKRIAVAYVEWSSRRQQKAVVPWRLIDGSESAEAFSRHLQSQPFVSERGTSISAALQFSARLFNDNGYDGARRAIDVSGDGPNNSGPPIAAVRDSLVAQGIVINGLPVLIRPSSLFPEMDRYYADCVVGGEGSFVLPVREVGEFAEAIRQKLILEIVARPPGRIVPVQAGEPVDCLIGEKLRDLYAPDYPGLND